MADRQDQFPREPNHSDIPAQPKGGPANSVNQGGSIWAWQGSQCRDVLAGWPPSTAVCDFFGRLSFGPGSCTSRGARPDPIDYCGLRGAGSIQFLSLRQRRDTSCRAPHCVSPGAEETKIPLQGPKQASATSGHIATAALLTR